MYSLKSGAPLCYTSFEGHPLDDCIGLMDSITKMKNMDLSDSSSTILLTQRGSNSLKDIAPLIEDNQRFITETTATSKDIKKVVSEIPLVHHFPQGMEWDLKQRLFFTQKPLELQLNKGGKTISEELIVNLYYDPLKAHREAKNIYNAFYQMQQLVSDYIYNGEWVEDEDDFSHDNDMLKIVYDKNGYAKSFVPDFEKISEKLDFCGYFALVSKGIELDPLSTLKIYRLREEHIEALRTLRGVFTPAKDKTDSVKMTAGKIFTTFINRIITETLQNFLNNNLVGYKYPKVEDLFEAMSEVDAQYRDDDLLRFRPFDIFQNFIARELGLEIP